MPKFRNVRNANVINGVPAAGASRWATGKFSPALSMCWNRLPVEGTAEVFGSASAIHKHFQRWRGQRFFLALWQAGLAEYDEMEGIAWSGKA